MCLCIWYCQVYLQLTQEANKLRELTQGPALWLYYETHTQNIHTEMNRSTHLNCYTYFHHCSFMGIDAKPLLANTLYLIHCEHMLLGDISNHLLWRELLRSKFWEIGGEIGLLRMVKDNTLLPQSFQLSRQSISAPLNDEFSSHTSSL